MRQSTHTDNRSMMRMNPVIVTMIILILSSLAGCGRDADPAVSSYANLPVIQSAHVCGSADEHLYPVRLLFRQDTLYVSYAGIARIDLYTPDLAKMGTIPLSDPEAVFPTDFVISDSGLFVCDHAKGAIVIYDRDGKFMNSYGTLPDNITPLRPFALAFFGGVLYAGDAGLHRVLAISMADAPGITEQGELILSFPHDSMHTIDFPTALLVTPDGRLLIGDAGRGRIDAYACDGRYIYPFGDLPTADPPGFQGIAMDNVRDPSMQDSTSFDPTGLRLLGRIHAVDVNAGKIHMYNPVGEYIASYPETDPLEKPSDIAIDKIRRHIYVAESGAGRIVMYRYGE